MSIASAPKYLNKADQETRYAWILFASTIAAVVLSGIWSLIVGTASPGADEKDLIQGWEGVMRNLPGYLFPVLLGALGVWFATKAGTHGLPRAKSALVATSLGLLFAMSSVTRDSAEVVMTTRAANGAWLTFGVDAVLVGIVFIAALRRIRRA